MDSADFEGFAVARIASLMRFGLLLSGDRQEAEDLVQGALASAYRHRRQLDPSGVESYVRRSIVNAHVNRWRRLLRRESPAEQVPERMAPDPFAGVHERLWAVQVLQRLPPRQRAVLVLRFLYDLDEAAVADELGISLGTVKSQSHKALAALRLQSEQSRQGVGHD